MSEQQSSNHPAAQRAGEPEIDQRVFDLYDAYCHGRIDRQTTEPAARAEREEPAGGVSAATTIVPWFTCQTWAWCRRHHTRGLP
jgi:carboxymethylenebutenolidase